MTTSSSTLPRPTHRASGAVTGLAIAVGSALAFSSSGPFVKPLLEGGWSLGAVLLVRMGLASLLLSPALIRAMRRQRGFLRQHGLLIAAFGLTAVAGCQLFYFAAMQRMPVAVALLILRSTWQLLKQSTGVLMEGVPTHLDYEAIGRALARIPGVADVHDLHVWEVSSGFPALSAHVTVGRDTDCHEVRRLVEERLHGEFDLEHTTLQVDHEGGALLAIALTALILFTMLILAETGG